MGVINLIFNEYILYTDVPLTIAGMMSSSMGYKAERICDSLENRAFSINNNTFPLMLGEYSFGKEEYKIPFMPIDLMLFYRELIKSSALGLIPKEELPIIDFKELFNRFLRCISIQDVAFEYNMGETRYSAERISERFSALLENVYEESTDPIPRLSCTPSMKRAYPVGINASNNVICVDGAEFGITNIEEAVHFFSKILNL